MTFLAKPPSTRSRTCQDVFFKEKAFRKEYTTSITLKQKMRYEMSGKYELNCKKWTPEMQWIYFNIVYIVVEYTKNIVKL